MTKTALISQPFGLGDVIFAQAIARKFKAEGYEIVWPVLKHYVNDCKRAYPYINFIPHSIVDPALLNWWQSAFASL